MPPLVLDTNIVLDVFVFDDEAAQPLRDALFARRLRWIATAAMRDELQRVLANPQIVPRLAFRKLASADVMAAFDLHATPVGEAPRAPVICKDPDDQKFIDLAVREGATLLSKDGQVLRLRKRLAELGVAAGPEFPG
ncbi:putative toxin-antitoxin system toxin component, PIN family [Ramlibacter henchirensis]|uniref:Putative toxin-antitoxin system toxin component, PIN family n=1 Tax=Ramlibacter henchirensis TaxID=204072 RepID=A0A4Z0C8B8_9BURK|nr:putative toxin-antitoxin system toxin component, PIN family [Ramlibacter henchirensis]TFZ06618.1 putative toxin-antitoxin system toxin component, PIN family [Ramlibacter henchirensis]